MAPRQAIVVIHGIGEQKPMSTLRSFAESLLEPREDGRQKFWSKPDNLSESYELRRLTTASAPNRPRADFYEYYWAYITEGTTVRHVLGWVKNLLLRRPRNVPRRLLWIWIFVWVFLVLALACSFRFGIESWKAGLASSILSLAFVSIFQTVFLYYIGDAARYLNPAPDNIAFRHSVRKGGIDLLRKLHESKRYDRIIVVGHSLGSVIGFDIVKHYWSELHQEYSLRHPDVRRSLQELEQAASTLSTRADAKAVAEFQEKQRKLWTDLRAAGTPWLVSDLVTVGSPLAHALLLLAEDTEDLKRRKSERDLPTCPPVSEVEHENRIVITYDWNGETRLHHAAHFALTRWTNLYFQGDFVGGPVGKALGPGVLDIRLNSPWWSIFPWSHTRYWSPASEVDMPNYMRALRDGIGLDCGDWLVSVKPAGKTLPPSSLERRPA